jgi:drug/metabolite transporter (DMT)-like permease
VLLHQRPSRGFWGFALLGAALVVAFAAWSGAGRPQLGDLLLLGAVIASSIGYISGVRVSSGPDAMTPEQTISWVLVLALPVTLPVLVTQWPAAPVRLAAWFGFGYVALFSMWMGFFAWYRGLAWGGTLRVSQVQLLQPFVSILLSRAVAGRTAAPGHAGLFRRRDGVRLSRPAHVGGAPRPRSDVRIPLRGPSSPTVRFTLKALP